MHSLDLVFLQDALHTHYLDFAFLQDALHVLKEFL